MPNKGFETSPLAHIRLIRDNLRDRYHDGFPVIKEIIQNADDATDATLMHFGWCPGFPNDVHPLMRGPAVFFMNDGAFTTDNEWAIRQMGLGHKAAEQSTVGKFGLGLKSVFHLCEAFLYLWSPPHSVDGTSVSGSILNPWSGSDPHTSKHESWDLLSDSTLRAIRTFLLPLPHTNKWFCLWVPLRRKDTLGNVTAITEAYPGDKPTPSTLDEVFCADLECQLAHVLPLLHRVRTLRAWMPCSEDHALTEILAVGLEPSSVQRQFPENIGDARQFPMKGRVAIARPHSQEATKEPCMYAGFETILDDRSLSDLRESIFWPKDISMNSETAEYKESPEKAEPHALVSFISTPCTSEKVAQLRISWAVFLPVGEYSEVCSLEGEADIHLTLHGYFFLDAGRKQIEGIDEGEPSSISDEASLRLAWNVRLRRLGVFPLMLPTLDSWVKEAVVSESVVRALTKTLSESRLFRHHRKDITRDHKWLCRIRHTGTKWELLGAIEPFFAVPMPPQSEPRRPFAVFPALVHLAEERSIICHESPYLATQGPSDWPEDLVIELIESVVVEDVFGKTPYLDYFADTASKFAICGNSRAAKAMARLLRKAFHALSLDVLRKSTAALKRLVAVLPEDWFFPIPESTPCELAMLFAGLDLSCVPISKLFFSGQGRLSEEDARLLLAALNTPPESLKRLPNWPETCSDLALHVVDVHGSGTLLDARPFSQFNVFRVRVCATATDALTSAEAILDAVECRVAFTYGSPPLPDGLAQELQHALTNRHVLLLTARTYQTIVRTERRPCDGHGCLDVLETMPRLAEPKARARLLGGLLKTTLNLTDVRSRQALRYLLHGSREHYADDSQLVAANTAHDENVWAKLVRLVLMDWRYVPTEVSSVLSPEHRLALRVSDVTPEDTVCILQESLGRLADLNLASLSDSERQVLLESIHDDSVLKNLPIHMTLSGQLVSIGPNTYLDGGVAAGSTVGAKLQIVRRLPDRRLADIQEDIIDILTAAKVIELALAEEDPVEQWRVIVNALQCLAGHPHRDLVTLLRECPWVPLRTTRGVAPKNILLIRGLENETARLVIPSDLGYCPAHLVLRECWAHHGFQDRITSILPSLQDSLEMLGEILVADDIYWAGSPPVDDARLAEFVRVFAGSGVMPLADIVGQILKAHQDALQDVRHYLLSHLTNAPSTDRFIRVLTYLAEAHKKANRTDKDIFAYWHDHYLETLRAANNVSSVLPKVELRNRAGKWKATAELCVAAENVRAEDILEERQARILGFAVTPAPQERVSPDKSPRVTEPLSLEEEDFNLGVQALREYFRDWRNRIPEELIGAFLVFLGDYPGIVKLTQEYLGQRSIEATRELLHWGTMMSLGVGGDEDVHMTMHKQRFLVTVLKGKAVEVLSVTGERFQAQLNDDVDSIFVGATFKDVWSLSQEKLGYRVTRLDLRHIDPDAVESDNALSLILRNSLERLFLHVYLRAVPSLDEFWMDMAKSEQLDIDIARNLLLESAFFYVGQLGVSKQHGELRDILSRYDHIRKQLAEEEHAAATTGKSAGGTGKAKALKDVKREFSDLLESDPEVQRATLLALRKKVCEHYQYTPQSIPFEIFQNADDATVELNEMRKEANLLPQQEPFVVAWQSGQLAFMHWGRPVNKFREGSFDGQHRGFDRDLERMLVLNASDKNVGDGSAGVTGKFGLGFKSVFLVSDRPRLKSGRLCLEILGGMWPKPLSMDACSELSNHLSSVRPDLRDGTAVVLGDLIEPAEAVLEKFQRLAGILLAFSRGIKQIDFHEGNMACRRVTWNETPLTESGALSLGCVTLPPEATQYLMLKITAGQGSLLFKMDFDGFGSLPKGIPTIWVTAPTEESSDLGFAINGPFPLDIGRAKLGRDSREYEALSHEIGFELGEHLCELYDLADSNWGEFSKTMRLGPDLDAYDFWESFWGLCVEPFAHRRRDRSNEAIALADEILWHSTESGIGQLLQTRASIPTGLWGSYRTLTSIRDVESAVVDSLSDAAVFDVVSDWEASKLLLMPGKTISESIFAVLCSLLLLARDHVEHVSLAMILQTDVPEGEDILPEKASCFGKVVTRAFLRDLESGTKFQQEEEATLLELLTAYCFKAEDGSFQSAQDLLVVDTFEETDSDERLRAAFAPAKFVLDGTYRDSALAFFLACRRRMNAPVERLKEWAIGADTQERRSAVLNYLLKGELGRDLGHQLRLVKAGTWFETIQGIEVFFPPNSPDKYEICGLLGVYPVIQPPPSPAPSPPVDPAKALELIQDWWFSVKDEKTADYERRTYPSDVMASLSSDYDCQDSEHRKSWLALFLLGMTHTIGRARPEQHRGFLDLCAKKGWLNVFAAEESSAEDWMKILDEYIDNPVDSGEFSHWMKLFPSIYRVAKYTNAYVEAFLAVDRFQKPFELRDVTSLSSSAVFQGGGYDAPDLARSLGIGSCFVMRELVRRKVLLQSHAHPHSFVPTKGVRNIVQALGCSDVTYLEGPRNSTHIYRFISEHLGSERATFGLSFDLPFLFLSEDPELQWELLGRDVSTSGRDDFEPGDFVTLCDGRVIPREYME